MTPEQITELATTLHDRYDDFATLTTPEWLEAVAGVIRDFVYTPPPGSVEVEIAVAACVDPEGGVSAGSHAIDQESPRDFAESQAFDDIDTHRAIVRAWIPPVAAVPTVEGVVQ